MAPGSLPAGAFDWHVCIVLALLTLSVGFVDQRIRAYPDLGYKTYVPAVLAGTAEAPGKYRVLAPAIYDVFRRSTGLSPESAWIATNLLWLAFSFAIMYVYLLTWFTVPQALAGTWLLAATLPLTFTNSWPHPDQFPELGLFTLGSWAAVTRRDALFGLALALATLNRETAVFLVLLYALTAPVSRRHVLRCVLFAGLWAVLFVGLRAWRGFESYDYWQLTRNLSFLRLIPPPRDIYYRSYAYFGIVLVGGLTLIGMRRLPSKPLFVRRALLVVPAFTLVALTISSIIETRIFTPLYAAVLPAALHTIFSPPPDCTVGLVEQL
jgi:hypothetical protein